MFFFARITYYEQSLNSVQSILKTGSLVDLKTLTLVSIVSSAYVSSQFIFQVPCLGVCVLSLLLAFLGLKQVLQYGVFLSVVDCFSIQRMLGTSLAFGLFPILVLVNFCGGVSLHRTIYKRFFEKRLGYIGIFQSKPTVKLELLTLGVFSVALGILCFVVLPLALNV